MLEYLAMLLAISFVLIAVFRLVKNRIPLRPQVFYGTVGISFALGAVFPMAISTLTLGGVLSIYFVLIVLSATSLGYAESRVSINTSPSPVKVSDLEPETSPEETVNSSLSSMAPEEITLLEACATEDYTSENGPLSNTAEEVQPPRIELSAPVEDMPALDDTTADLDLAATINESGNEALHDSDNLSLKFEVFEEVTVPITEDPVEEETFTEESVMEEPVIETPVIETPVIESLTIKEPIAAEEPFLKEKPVASVLYNTKENLFEIEKTLPEDNQKLPTAQEEYPAAEEVTLNEKLTTCKEFPEQSSVLTTDEYSLNEEPLSGEPREEPTTAEEQLPDEQPACEEPVFEERLSLQYGDEFEGYLPLQCGVEAKEAITPPRPEQIAEDGLVTCQDDPPFTPVPGNEEICEEIRDSDPAVIKADPVTVNDYISAGFEARARGDMTGAAEFFFKALRLNQGQQISVALAMEVSAVYQELGQYLQAGMILKSVMGQEDILHDPNLMQNIQSQLIYLDSLGKLLRMAKMTNAPHSKVPNLIKIKANLETAKRLTELTEGGRVIEKQPTDFGVTGS